MANVPKILVIGVGGGGNNALDRMIESKLSGVNYLAVNTDAQVLMEGKAEENLQIGKKLTRGYGAGADPQVGEAAAIESEEEIRAMVKNTDMCIITCGTYGGTVEVRGEYNRYSAVPSRHGTEKALIYAEKEENILFFLLSGKKNLYTLYKIYM